MVMSYGALTLISGTVISIGALSMHSAIAFFLGSIIAGSGFGAGFQGATRTVLPVAKVHERAGVLSVVFVVSYLLMGLPAVAAGFFISHGSSLLSTAQSFGMAVAVLAGLALPGTLLAGKGNDAQALIFQ